MIVENCPYHNPGSDYVFDSCDWWQRDKTVELYEALVPNAAILQIPEWGSHRTFHFCTHICASSTDPTTSECRIFVTEKEMHTLWHVTSSEVYQFECYKVLFGPEGSKNKYLAVDGASRYWYNPLFSLGKFRDYGTFLNVGEAYTFANELIYQTIAQLNERILQNSLHRLKYEGVIKLKDFQ